MTPPDKTTRSRDAVLEQILDTVVSIDRNVQEILDRVGDHIDDLRYASHWDSDGYEPNHEH